MNPHQFHLEHSRLMTAELERAASRRHDAPSRRRTRLRDALAGRVHLRVGRVGTAPRTA